MIELILLGILVLLAVLALQSENLRHAVIYFSVFSLICSVLYLYYQAPDVAIAEAVMGSGLITLLYLTALRRYKVYSICFTNTDVETVRDHDILKGSRRGQLIHDIENFCLTRELDPQVAYTPQKVLDILRSGQHDLIIHQSGGKTTVLGNRDNVILDGLETLFAMRYPDLNILVEYFTDNEMQPVNPLALEDE